MLVHLLSDLATFHRRHRQVIEGSSCAVVALYNKPFGKGCRAIANGNGSHRRLAASRHKCNNVKWELGSKEVTDVGGRMDVDGAIVPKVFLRG